MAERQEVPMDTSDPFSGAPSVGHAAYATAQMGMDKPVWTISGKKQIQLLQWFCKHYLDHLVNNNYVGIMHFGDTLQIYIHNWDKKPLIVDSIEIMQKKLDNILCDEVRIQSDNYHLIHGPLQNYIDNRNRETYQRILLLNCPGTTSVKIYAEEMWISGEKTKLQLEIERFLSKSQAPSHHAAAQNSNLAASSQRSSYQPRENVYNMRRNHVKPVFKTHFGLEVFLLKHSIVDLEVDGIVNAANEKLEHIGGVAYHIATAAGFLMEQECKKIISRHGSLLVCENVATGGGNLKCRKIIHAVGPRWKDFHRKDKCLDKLSETVTNALKTADEEHLHSLAMPAISAGIYGVPKPLCAAMYIHGIMKFGRISGFSPSLKYLYIVDINGDILEEIKKAYSSWVTDSTSIEPSELLKSFKVPTSNSSFSTSVRQTNGGASWRSSSDNDMSSTQRNTSLNSKSTRGLLGGPHDVKLHRSSSKQDWTRYPDSVIQGLGDKAKHYKLDGEDFSVKVYTGSITRVRDLDGIICSADTHLTGVGPLSEAVSKAGGDRYKKGFSQMRQKSPTTVKPGNVFRCHGGDMNVEWVFHLVVDQLPSTSSNSLKEYKESVVSGFWHIDKWKAKSVALPLIAGGFVQHDKREIQKVCEILYEAVMEFCQEKKGGRTLREIHFVNKKSEITQAFVECFDKHSKVVTQTKGSASQQSRTRNSDDLNALAGLSITDEGDNSTPMKLSSGYDPSLGTRPKTKGSFPGTKSPEAHGHEGTSKPSRNGRLSQSLYDRDRKTSAGKNRDKSMSFWSPQSSGTSPVIKETLTTRDRRSQEEEHLEEESTQQPKKYSQCASCDQPFTEDNVTHLPCGHSFCTTPCFIPMSRNQKCFICGEGACAETEDDETCAICMDTVTDKKVLPCGHLFCSDCINKSLVYKPACPVCGKIFGKLEGDQPENGTMTSEIKKFPSLPGYEGFGHIAIKYIFPGGIQGENHPQPGKRYKGTERRAYLPNNKEGQKVLRLLKKAFERRLVFTIGSSRTTGQDSVVTWNDIHHKTKMDGGATKFGYPDETYLSRVQEELAAKGITED